MRTLLLVLVGLAAVLPATAHAWSRAGHMAIAAIAGRELKQTDPAQLARVVQILKAHPHYQSRWKAKLQERNGEEQQTLLLLMLAARWPDDIRGTPFDDGPAHYINIPYKPAGEPASVAVSQPGDHNIIEDFESQLALLAGDRPDAEKAVALCWVFHQVGDVHQPLHVVSLFTTQYPNGDRGGTRFYIRPTPSGATLSLHQFWDELPGTKDDFRSTRNRATALRLAHPRSAFPQLAEPRFETWAAAESFALARTVTYREGTLAGSPDRHAGTPLPPDYAATAKPIAEQQATLAGYRLADILQRLDL